jgi:hypothetical protein
MKHASTLIVSLALAVPGFAIAQAPAAEPARSTQQTQTQTQEPIYGSELMTPQERAEYQTRMRAAKTEQEREAIRLEHHKQMQERARAQGKTLPETPPADRGPGMGPGGGSGGMGPGGGKRMGY